MISIADLTTALTRQQLEKSCYDVLGILGVNTTSWKPGAVVRAMITAFALIGSAFSSLMAAIARSGFLDTATSSWLTLVAQYVYGVARIEATFAAGQVTLTNTTGGLYVFDIDDLTVRNGTTGKTYRNSTAFTLNPLETLTVPVVAVEAGSASTASAGAVNAVESGPSNILVSNADAIVGQDEESDPALRARSREKLGALSPNGPWDAYSYAAKNAVRADGTPIGVTRVRVDRDGYGNVFVYVATATGEVTGTVGNLATDLGCVDEAMQQNAAPLCVTLNTYTAAPVSVPITYRAWAYNNSGLTEAQIISTIEARLTSFFAAHPIGGNKADTASGKVWKDGISGEIKAALYPYIFHVVVTLPTDDVTLLINQVPQAGTITPTITLVAPPDGGLG